MSQDPSKRDILMILETRKELNIIAPKVEVIAMIPPFNTFKTSNTT
jgi:hypothetical protein